MSFAIINGSGNVLEWFDHEQSARDALAEFHAESPGAVADLVEFDASGMLIAGNVAPRRMFWIGSNNMASTALVVGGSTAFIRSNDVQPVPANETNDRVPVTA
jgi:hypothetical protein